MTKLKLCASADVRDGEIRRCEQPDGPAIAVCRVAGQVYATDDLCTHGEASLSEGEIENGEIVCPYHLGKFDIKTGEATGAPCSVALRTYCVMESDGVIYLQN